MAPLSVERRRREFWRRVGSAIFERRWQFVFLVLSTLLVGFGIQEGFVYAQVNNFSDQAVQLPILYSYADDTLFQGDILLDARENYMTFFYPVLGFLSRYVPSNLLLLGLYVASLGMTVTGMYYLAEHLFPGRHVGPIAVLLWTTWLPNPGGDFLHSSFPTHTTTAIGIQLVGLALALRQRHLLAAALIGFSANINAMTAVSFAMVWAFLLLRERELWSWRLVRIPLMMGLMASPVMIWRLVTSSAIIEEQSVPVETFVEIMRVRLWYAIFPFSVNLQLWVLFGLVIAFWVYAARFAPRETNRKVLWMSQGIVLLGIVGTLFTELIPVPFIIQLHWCVAPGCSTCLRRSTWPTSFTPGWVAIVGRL
ncbi:MAG: hypothetical protein HC915_15930 [Anaerolineae bacterium]|nr:hypothetical protein [Anaerolineae bacterium]